MADTFEAYRTHDGALRRFTDLGGYPLIYIARDGSCFCAKCADDTKNAAYAVDVHWEGDPISCDDCQCEIESAYGPVESAAS